MLLRDEQHVGLTAGPCQLHLEWAGEDSAEIMDRDVRRQQGVCCWYYTEGWPVPQPLIASAQLQKEPEQSKLPVINDNPRYSQLQAQIDDLKQRRVALLQLYQENHYRVRNLDAELAALQKRLKQEPEETPFSFIETYGPRNHPDPVYHEHFAVSDVPPGDYTLGVEIEGKKVLRRIRVAAGKLTWVEFRPDAH